MSSSERAIHRNPFNPTHFTADLFESRQPVQRVRTEFPPTPLQGNNSFELPTSSPRELKWQAMRDSKAYQGALEAIGGRIPAMGGALHEVESGLRLDNVAIVGDALQTSAQLATFLYDRVTTGLVGQAPEMDKFVRKIQEGKNTLEEAVWFLNQIRTTLPRMLDRKPKPGNHPSLRLKPEGLIALSVLSAVSLDAKGGAEITEAALDILKTKNPYALRLYHENLGLFQAPNPSDSNLLHFGQYI